LREARVFDALDIIYHVHLPLNIAQGNTDGSASRRDVLKPNQYDSLVRRRDAYLEACSSRVVQSLAELLHQRPCIQSVKKVDVSRSSTEHLERQVRVLHEDSSRLLVRVGAISQGQLLLSIASILLPEEV
jgi:hypothetical protein